ncbi:hypothetical protein LX36DRAFT_683976 [Colletotrichum falcatum]|nr:hypothetical protein LX36DRAFT_683976 [Colletotrichum falcatum]
MKADCQRAADAWPLLTLMLAFFQSFPTKIGCEGSGVFVAVGSEVKGLKVGDAVYRAAVTRPAFSGPDPGFFSEHALVEEKEAASLSGYTVTTYQTIKFGALSGGSFTAIHVPPKVFDAKKVISTVSTAKIDLFEKCLPGLVDQLIDYNTTDIGDLAPRGSVDLMVSTPWTTMSSVTEVMGPDAAPEWLFWLLDISHLWYKWKLLGTNIIHGFKGFFRVSDLSDIKRVGEECQRAGSGKGGVGRCIIRIRECEVFSLYEDP